MDYDEQDFEVVRLLSMLKQADSNYPTDLMVSRRQQFVKQIAALGIGTGAALALKVAAKAAGGSTIPAIASTVTEMALIVAIVAEAGYVAFVNRQKVLDVFRTISGQPTIQQVTAAPEFSHPMLAPTELVETEFIFTAEPTLAPTLMTETPTPVGTPSPEMLVATESAAAGGSSSSDAQPNSTPNPGANNGGNSNNGNNGNNGHHYGQTPRPERTKQSGGNGGNSNNNNNNQNNNNQNNENSNNGNGRGH